MQKLTRKEHELEDFVKYFFGHEIPLKISIKTNSFISTGTPSSWTASRSTPYTRSCSRPTTTSVPPIHRLWRWQGRGENNKKPTTRTFDEIFVAVVSLLLKVVEIVLT